MLPLVFVFFFIPIFIEFFLSRPYAANYYVLAKSGEITLAHGLQTGTLFDFKSAHTIALKPIYLKTEEEINLQKHPLKI